MEHITKPSITRLARKAGVKSLSDDCYPLIHSIIEEKLEKLIASALIVNSEHNTKTLMADDIYSSLVLGGYRVAQSTELAASTCAK